MRYGFGCDHAGIELKQPLIAELIAAGHEVVDMGTYDTERADFPVYADKVAQGVSNGELDIEAGRALVIAYNKWDLVDEERQHYLEREIDRQLHTARWAPRVNISAATGRHQ